jgi:hypothetical protein
MGRFETYHSNDVLTNELRCSEKRIEVGMPILLISLVQ